MGSCMTHDPNNNTDVPPSPPRGFTHTATLVTETAASNPAVSPANTENADTSASSPVFSSTNTETADTSASNPAVSPANTENTDTSASSPVFSSTNTETADTSASSPVFSSTNTETADTSASSPVFSSTNTETADTSAAFSAKNSLNDANTKVPARKSEEPQEDTTSQNNTDSETDKHNTEQCNCPRHRPLYRGDTVRVDCKCGSKSCNDGEVGIYLGRANRDDSNIDDDDDAKDKGFLVATLNSCSCCDSQKIICVSHRTKLICCPNELPPNVRCPISFEIMQKPAYARSEPKMQRIEHKNLLQWVNRHKSNPLTRKTVRVEDIVVDKKLQSIIQLWQERNPKHCDHVLRFKVGDKVLANCRDGWHKGTIVRLWGGAHAYYSIELESGGRVTAPSDTDSCVKARTSSSSSAAAAAV